MKKGNMNKILLWGIILNSVRLVLDYYTDIPDYLSVALLVLAIVMMLVGIYITSKELRSESDSEENS